MRDAAGIDKKGRTSNCRPFPGLHPHPKPRLSAKQCNGADMTRDRFAVRPKPAPVRPHVLGMAPRRALFLHRLSKLVHPPTRPGRGKIADRRTQAEYHTRRRVRCPEPVGGACAVAFFGSVSVARGFSACEWKADCALLGADEGFVEVCSVPCPAKSAPKRPFDGPRRQSGESRSPPGRRIGVSRLSPAGEAAIRRLGRADPPASASVGGGLRAPRPRPAPSSRTTPSPSAPSSSLVPG